MNKGHTVISFIFTFKLLVNLSDSHFLICIRFNDSVSKGHTPLTFIQPCTFLLVTLIHFSKQGLVNSLTILLLYVYVHNLHWTKLVELSCKWQWQRMYTMSYCYGHTWAVMALVDSIVVRCTRLDDYNTCIFISALAHWPFFIFNVVSFLPLTPRGFVWLHWLGDTFPIFPMWFFGFSYQAAHTFFHCTFWFVGTSSFCWRSSCFGLGWGGPFTRSLLWAVAGVPSPLLG